MTKFTTTHTNLNHVALSDIEVGERFRKEYKDIDLLAQSINKNGLITPIAIGLASKIDFKRETDRPYVLLAGGRRMKAVEFLQWTNVPCRIYDQHLTELDFRSIELAENLDRKEMSFAEEIALKKEINSLQISIHGRKITKAPDAPGWSQADTARLIKESPATLARDLQLADAIEKFPELKLDSCKTKNEAFKRLKSVGKTIHNNIKATEYAQSVGSSDTLFKKLSSAYIIGDCLETMKKMPSNTIQFIEIDPPYAIDLPTIKRDNDCNGYNEISVTDYLDLMKKVFSESYRIMKEGSWLICWFGPDPWFQHIVDLLRECKFTLNTIPGIWSKPNGQTMQPEIYLANSYETFFYARKGNARIQKPGRPNIFHYSPVAPAKKYHPTQRPLTLMQEIYSTFCAPGTVGYIPFLGSGVGLLASHTLQMNMLGNDLNSSYKDGYILQLKEILK